MTNNLYEIGDRVRIRTTTPFQDTSEVAFDPQVVKFQVKEPGQDTVTYTYGSAANVTKLATGDYACDVDVNTKGTWLYHIIGEQATGENRGGDQGKFQVRSKAT